MEATTFNFDQIDKIIHPACLAADPERLFEDKPKGEIDLAVVCKQKTISYRLIKFFEPKEKRPLLPFFNHNVPDLTKLCDYLIFVDDGSELFVFAVELKKSHQKIGHARKQLHAGTLLAEFIIKSIQRIGYWPPSLKYSIRQICFPEKSAIRKKKEKNKQKQQRKFAHIQPKKPTRIPQPSFEDGHMNYDLSSKTFLIDAILDAARRETPPRRQKATNS